MPDFFPTNTSLTNPETTSLISKYQKNTLSAALATILTLGGAEQAQAAFIDLSAPSSVSEGVGTVAVTISVELDNVDTAPNTSCTVNGILRVEEDSDSEGSRIDTNDASIASPNFSITYEPDLNKKGILSRAVPVTINVNINDDAEVEDNEDGQFYAEVTSTTCSFYGGVPADTKAAFTIIDNDSINEDTPTVDTATKQVIVSMGNLSLQGAKVQSQNLSKQLRRLRTGLRGNDFSSLKLNIDGQTLSGNELNKILGAGAGDESLNSQWGTFVGGSVQIGEQDASGTSNGYQFNVDSLFAGVDYQLNESIVLGAALGYTDSSSELDHNAGETTLSGLSLGVFSSYYYKDTYYIDAILSYGQSDYETLRNVAVGSATEKAKGETDGNEITLALNTGYYFRRSNYFIQVFGGLNYIDANIDSFDEKNGSGGSSITLLGVDDQNQKSLTTNLGIEYGWVINARSAVITPQLSIDWEHQYKDDTEVISGRFIGDPGNTTFSIDSNEQDRNYFNAGFTINAVFKGGFTAYTSYEIDLARDNFDVYDFSIGGRWEF